MARSSTSTHTRNWGAFLQNVAANQHLQDESTDTSLQPGEEYPTTPHPHMIHAHKQTHSTLNQITILIEASASSVPLAERAQFSAQKLEYEDNWLYPYTVENPCGTQLFEHWQSQFNTAVVQTVSTEFQLQRRLSKEGKDLYNQGTAGFLDGDPSKFSVTAKGLQICQPLLLENMYCCTNKTMRQLRQFCINNRPDLSTDTAGTDSFSIARAEKDAQKYQNVVLAQLLELQAACSHTAQLFLRKLIPGASNETSHLFLSLKNARQIHYEAQSALPIKTRVPYGMHHILRYIREHTVRDDAVALHVVEHDMLLHTRPSGQNIYMWCLSFAPNIRRHRQATAPKRHMTPKETHMFISKIFSSQLTAKELETLASLDKTGILDKLSTGVFDMVSLKSLITENMSQFNRTYAPDRRVHLFHVNHEIRMRGKAQPLPTKKRKAHDSTAQPDPKASRHRGNEKSTVKIQLLADLQPHEYCKHHTCIKNNKQHTHTPASCGYNKREALTKNGSGRPPDRFQRDRADAQRPRQSGPKPPIKCFFCNGDHFKRDCQKFAKLQNSQTFMATMDTYDDNEMQCLDLLICTTNKAVCKWCLQSDCDGACGEVSPAMASAKQKFFTDGSYEQVLLAKAERQCNKFGHSPFSRDSYLSTQPSRESEEADIEDEPTNQEDISIMSKSRLNEKEAQLLQATLAKERDSKGYESDRSSVEENDDQCEN
jgi:hypothetical protein